MSAPSDERLMRYFDGESDDAEAREIEEWLSTSEHGRLVASSFARVGDAVRAIGDERGAPGGDVADAVMGRLAEVRRGNVRKLGDREAARHTGSRGRRWSAAAPALGLALAAAAAVLLYLRPKTPSNGYPRTAAVAIASERGTTVAPTPSEGALASDDRGAGAAIESVDFGAVAGTIFMVPSGASSDEAETPVVWLMDEPAANEGRMAPL